MTQTEAGMRTGGRLIKLLMPASALLATAAGLLLSLIAPHFLPGSAYVEFSLLFGYGQLAATLLFEWSRQAALRYAYGRDDGLAEQRRRTLTTVYAAAACLLVLGGLIALLAPGAPTVVRLGGVIALYAAAQGVFDARQAFARAAGDDIRFTISLLSRAVLSLGLFAAVAWLTRDGAMATLALCASYVASTLATAWGQRRANPFGGVAPDQMRFLLAYGLTGAVAAIVAIAAPNIVRSAAVASLGTADSGGFLLALDLSQKGLTAIGMVASLVLTQKLYRTVEFHGRERVLEQGRLHIGLTLGVLAPAFIGFVLVQDQLAAAIVPTDFHSAYLAWIAPLSLGAFLTCVRIYAIDSFFYAHGRTRLVLTGAVINIAVLALTLVVAPMTRGQVAPLVWIYVTGSGLALMVSVYLVHKHVTPTWPWKDMGSIALACGGMAAAGAAPFGVSALDLFLKTALCGACYLAIVFLLDGCGLRALARTLVAKTPSASL